MYFVEFSLTPISSADDAISLTNKPTDQPHIEAAKVIDGS